MNPGLGTYLNLLWTFGVMSLLAVGGANATIPEMHRVAVDVNHWLTDAQFADMFAIAQFSPGPNVLIVTLIGYQVAGLAGAAVTTFAMCGPAGVLAYFVANFFHRSSQSFWPSIIQASFVPVSIGLMAAGGYVLAVTVDTSLAATLVTLATALVAVGTRINPLWPLAVAGILGYAGFI
ncbi:chromate transporter [[Pseudomonas] carboxydohydrogena]|uniref:Chromate transporter n=1 Tax=Afipia carboxydohydrogena TaxID=290 RepID=A0ABY8BR86_AFICR|nr:chromate transporter [[Pseudomonas] carboxydohydrogena]WEF52509.1 chromate transporter [[Pseudomonas] carboxydohydrogena]